MIGTSVVVFSAGTTIQTRQHAPSGELHAEEAINSDQEPSAESHYALLVR